MWYKIIMWVMKYLKYYESKITRTKEISDYCEYNLAYLLDDDYYYKVSISRKAVLVISNEMIVVLESNKQFDTIMIGKKYGFFLDDVRLEIISTVAFFTETVVSILPSTLGGPATDWLTFACFEPSGGTPW